MNKLYINTEHIVKFLDKLYNMLDMYEVTPAINSLEEFKSDINTMTTSNTKQLDYHDLDKLVADIESKFSQIPDKQQETKDELLQKWQVILFKQYKLNYPTPKYHNKIVIPKQRLRKYILCEYTNQAGQKEELKVLPGMLKKISTESY